MPRYDYRCNECGEEYEARHGFDDSAPACPNGHEDVQRVITSAPTHARGALTYAGDSRRATKEQLKDKWREETPKLRKELANRLGTSEEKVSQMAPSLGSSDD